MTDHNAPGVYTQPGGDADDVLGHRFVANDKKADRIAQNDEAADDVEDDAEGHRIAAMDRVQDRVQLTDDDVEGHVAVRDGQPGIAHRDAEPGFAARLHDDSDDTEGHIRVAYDTAPGQTDDEADDVEGHRFQDRVQDRQVADDGDDVEGHKKA